MEGGIEVQLLEFLLGRGEGVAGMAGVDGGDDDNVELYIMGGVEGSIWGGL